MQVRAKQTGFIRVQTVKGMRSRQVDAGAVFELPPGTDIAPWMEEVKAAPAPAKSKDAGKKPEPEGDKPPAKGTGDSEVI